MDPGETPFTTQSRELYEETCTMLYVSKKKNKFIINCCDGRAITVTAAYIMDQDMIDKFHPRRKMVFRTWVFCIPDTKFSDKLFQQKRTQMKYMSKHYVELKS